ncbi:hypothetical protein Plhal304r1_c026g0086541 [Plasmopara halstedii]
MGRFSSITESHRFHVYQYFRAYESSHFHHDAIRISKSCTIIQSRGNVRCRCTVLTRYTSS